MSNNDLWCNKCQSHHHPIECSLDIEEKKVGRKSRLRIRGNDRFIMMLCRDARRRWMQYATNRRDAKKNEKCEKCKRRVASEWDHIEPLGARPRAIDETLLVYLQKMIYGKCQALCFVCHKDKTAKERKRRLK